MTCSCFCHEVEMHSLAFPSPLGCSVCAGVHVIPETSTTNELVHGTYKLTPAALYQMDAQVWATPDPLTDSVTYRLHLKVGHVVYGSSVSMASWPQANAHTLQGLLCAKMSAHFNKTGWPTAVLAVLGGQPWTKPNASIPGPNDVSGQRVLSDLQRAIPGLRTRQRCPARGIEQCPVAHPLERLIQHVNDQHRWTRAQIADWLESLDVDLSFPAEPPPELPLADPDRLLFIVSTTYAAAQGEAHRRRRPPRTWSFLGTRNSNTWHELRGRRGAQYVVLGHTSVPAELMHELRASQVIEVGEENFRSWPQAGEIDYAEFVQVSTTAEEAVSSMTQKLLAQLSAYDTKPFEIPSAKKEVTPPKKKETPVLQLKAAMAEHQQHLKHNPTKSRRTQKS